MDQKRDSDFVTAPQLGPGMLFSSRRWSLPRINLLLLLSKAVSFSDKMLSFSKSHQRMISSNLISHVMYVEANFKLFLTLNVNVNSFRDMTLL